MLQAFFLLAGAAGVFAVPVSNTADGGPPDLDNGCPMGVDPGSQGCHTESSNVTIQRLSNSPRPRSALGDCECNDDGEYWCQGIVRVPIIDGFVCPPGASEPIPGPGPDPPVTTESITVPPTTITVPPTTITVYPPTTSPVTTITSTTSSQPQPSKSSSTKTSTSDGPTPSPPSSSSAVPTTSTRTTGVPTSSSQLTSSTPSSITETTTSKPTPTSTGSPHPPGRQPCAAAPTLLKELEVLWVALEGGFTPEARSEWEQHTGPDERSSFLEELVNQLKGLDDDDFTPWGIEPWYAAELRRKPEIRARTSEYVSNGSVILDSQASYLMERSKYEYILIMDPALYTKTANTVRNEVCMYRAAFDGDELPPGPTRGYWVDLLAMLEELMNFLLSIKKA